MRSTLSRKSDTTCAEIGTVLMAIANSICDEAITSTFDTRFKIMPLAATNGIIANANSIGLQAEGQIFHCQYIIC